MRMRAERGRGRRGGGGGEEAEEKAAAVARTGQVFLELAGRWMDGWVGEIGRAHV